MRVLLAGVSLDYTYLIRQWLTRSGYEVEVVPSGGEALTSVEASSPDLLICDIFMPDMFGFQLVAKLRQDTRFVDLKVIILGSSPPIPDRYYPSYERSGYDANLGHFQRAHLTSSKLLSAVNDMVSIEKTE